MSKFQCRILCRDVLSPGISVSELSSKAVFCFISPQRSWHIQNRRIYEGFILRHFITETSIFITPVKDMNASLLLDESKMER
jgi:hypothetical protein